MLWLLLRRVTLPAILVPMVTHSSNPTLTPCLHVCCFAEQCSVSSAWPAVYSGDWCQAITFTTSLLTVTQTLSYLFTASRNLHETSDRVKNSFTAVGYSCLAGVHTRMKARSCQITRTDASIWNISKGCEGRWSYWPLTRTSRYAWSIKSKSLNITKLSQPLYICTDSRFPL